MEAAEKFLRALEMRAGRKLKVRINNNRSTMLSVHWAPGHTKVSMHRMFLSAPRNVMEALACYLRGESKKIGPAIRSFIEEGVKQLDYSYLLDAKVLCSQGQVYNLQSIYERLNRDYFRGRLNLRICWFGKTVRRRRRKITFGLYDETLKLIKVHRILDSVRVPRHVVGFVVYHEMVHHVCPPYVDEIGIHRMHTCNFKAIERRYRHYQSAQRWIADHKEGLFMGKILI